MVALHCERYAPLQHATAGVTTSLRAPCASHPLHHFIPTQHDAMV
jgi:hypothetical protein